MRAGLVEKKPFVSAIQANITKAVNILIIFQTVILVQVNIRGVYLFKISQQFVLMLLLVLRYSRVVIHFMNIVSNN